MKLAWHTKNEDRPPGKGTGLNIETCDGSSLSALPQVILEARNDNSFGPPRKEKRHM